MCCGPGGLGGCLPRHPPPPGALHLPAPTTTTAATPSSNWPVSNNQRRRRGLQIRSSAPLPSPPVGLVRVRACGPARPRQVNLVYYDTRALLTLVYSFARMDYIPPASFVRQLLRQCRQHLPVMPPRDLVLLLWALAHKGLVQRVTYQSEFRDEFLEVRVEGGRRAARGRRASAGTGRGEGKGREGGGL